MVAGATWPEQIERVRETCPDQVLLVPGVGAQQGAVEDAAVERVCFGEFLRYWGLGGDGGTR